MPSLNVSRTCRATPLLLIAGVLIAARLPAQSATGVIGGTVRDAAGKPIADLMIVVESASTSAPQSLAQATAFTDGTGRYRLDVAPGRYTVKAGGCPRGLLQPCSSDAPIYVYYPAAEMRTGATVIAIDVGTSRNDVDLVLNLAAVSAMQQEGARLQALAPHLWRLRDHDPARTASWSSLEGMHDYFVAKFIATPGMGSGRMAAMTLWIDPDQRLLLTQRKQQAWSVAQPDLIGIAKHERPVVFTRVAHGVYEESDRTLTASEENSLVELKAGKDVVSGRGEAGAMLVYGAIRARAECLRCHRPAGEGSLLGAFRYVLLPFR